MGFCGRNINKKKKNLTAAEIEIIDKEKNKTSNKLGSQHTERLFCPESRDSWTYMKDTHSPPFFTKEGRLDINTFKQRSFVLFGCEQLTIRAVV